MKRKSIFLAALLMAGCDRPVSRSDARDIAEDMADSHTRQLEGRVSDLEQKVARLEKDQLTTVQLFNDALDEERANRRAETKALRDKQNIHVAADH